MTIRRRIILTLSAVLLILILILVFHSYLFMSSSFKRLEEDTVMQEIERTHSLIDREVQNLSSITHDWSSWDDTYYFMSHKNESYIENNLMVDTLTNLSLNFILFVGTDGEVVHSKAVDLQTEHEIPFPQELIKILKSPEFLFVDSSDVGVTGVISMNGFPVILAAHPILTSNDEGPVNGTLVFAKVIDEALAEDFSNILQFPIKFHTYDSDELPLTVNAALADNQTRVIPAPDDSTLIEGYSVLYDIDDNPSFVIEVDISRAIFAQGRMTFFYYLAAIIVISLIFILIVGVAVDRFIVKRIKLLSLNITKTSENGSLSAPLIVNQKDELLLLNEEIDKMRIRLEQSSRAILNNEKFYSTLVEKNNDGIIMLGKGKIKFSNSRMAEMIGYSPDELIDKFYTDYVAAEYKVFVEDDYRIRVTGKNVPDKYEVALLTRDKRKLQVEVSLRTVNIERKPVVIAVVRDITNRKLIEERLVAADKLFFVYKEIANILQEINESLTSIIEYTGSSLENKLPGEIRNDIEDANAEAKSALEKIKNIAILDRV